MTFRKNINMENACTANNEYIRYNIQLESNLLHKFKQLDSSGKHEYLRAQTAIHVYDLRSGRFVNSTPDTHLTYAWHNNDIVPLSSLRTGPSLDPHRYAYLCSELEFVYSRHLLHTLKNYSKLVAVGLVHDL